MIKQIKKIILDTFFPKECLICGAADDYFCPDCQKKLIHLPEDVCLICNKNKAINGVCFSCQEKTSLDGIIAAVKFSNTVAEKVIHELKYNYIEELAEQLANLLIRRIIEKDFLGQLQNQILIPVPLHKKRFLERGFNQSQLLAEYLQKKFACNVQTNIVKRKKKTQQQAKLKREKRFDNVSGAFELLDEQKIKGQKIFILDDVITSGATINEIAKLLKNHGADKVYGLAVGHG